MRKDLFGICCTASRFALSPNSRRNLAHVGKCSHVRSARRSTCHHISGNTLTTHRLECDFKTIFKKWCYFRTRISRNVVNEREIWDIVRRPVSLLPQNVGLIGTYHKTKKSESLNHVFNDGQLEITQGFVQQSTKYQALKVDQE